MTILLNLEAVNMDTAPLEFFYSGGYFNGESIAYARIEKDGEIYRVVFYEEELQFGYFYDDDNLELLQRRSITHRQECRNYLQAVNTVLHHYSLPLRSTQHIYIHYTRDFTTILKEYFGNNCFHYAFFIRDHDSEEGLNPFKFLRELNSFE